MPGGRPSAYTDEVAAEILDAISQGKTLTSITKPDYMPCFSTVKEWVYYGEDPERIGKPENKHFEVFSTNYHRAREKQVDCWVEQCTDIADDDSLDIGFTEDGKPFVNKEHIMRSKLRVETRQKVAAMLNARKYGTQRIEQRQVDKDGNDVAVNINIIAPK